MIDLNGVMTWVGLKISSYTLIRSSGGSRPKALKDAMLGSDMTGGCGRV